MSFLELSIPTTFYRQNLNAGTLDLHFVCMNRALMGSIPLRLLEMKSIKRQMNLFSNQIYYLNE